MVNDDITNDEMNELIQFFETSTLNDILGKTSFNLILLPDKCISEKIVVNVTDAMLAPFQHAGLFYDIRQIGLFHHGPGRIDYTPWQYAHAHGITKKYTYPIQWQDIESGIIEERTGNDGRKYNALAPMNRDNKMLQDAKKADNCVIIAIYKDDSDSTVYIKDTVAAGRRLGIEAITFNISTRAKRHTNKTPGIILPKAKKRSKK